MSGRIFFYLWIDLLQINYFFINVTFSTVFKEKTICKKNAFCHVTYGASNVYLMVLGV